MTLPTPTGTEWPQLVSASPPFSMSGVLRGYDAVGVFEPRLLFEVPLTGAGTATVEMLAQPKASRADPADVLPSPIRVQSERRTQRTEP